MIKYYAIKSTETIINQIKPYKYVSFDIFDTVLKRDVPEPKDVFKCIENYYRLNGFVEARIQAEKKARRNSHKEEISFKDIYHNIDNSFKKLENCEIEMEKKLLRNNLFLQPVLDYCRKTGKKIILISDMYLSVFFIKELLKKYQIPYDELYVSSDIGVQKITGDLFQHVLKNENISGKELIHIGDSVRGDFLGARRAGINSILIPRMILRSTLIHSSTNTSLSCFLNNTLDLNKDKCWQLGYTALGPLLYGFITWLHAEIKKRHLNKVYFFSRDGWLMKKSWEQVYGKDDAVRYIYVSRRSLSVPLLWKYSQWEEIGNIMTMTRFFSVKTFLKRLGLSADNYMEQVGVCGLTPDTMLSEAFYLKNAKLNRLYELVKDDVVENSKREYEGLMQYLREMDFCGRMAVVDIGWGGSMQKNLGNILKDAKIDAYMEGFYFGVKKHIYGQSMHGYLYDLKHREMEADISCMGGLFESFFLAPDGSTKCYHLENGKVIIGFSKPEYGKDDIERIAFSGIQEGALAFIYKYKNAREAELMPLDKWDWSENVINLGKWPSKQEMDFFGPFRFFDTEIVKFANPRRVMYYLLHPRQCLYEFSISSWKQAFLLQLFHIRLPWYQMLYKLRNIFHK